MRLTGMPPRRNFRLDPVTQRARQQAPGRSGAAGAVSTSAGSLSPCSWWLIRGAGKGRRGKLSEPVIYRQPRMPGFAFAGGLLEKLPPAVRGAGREGALVSLCNSCCTGLEAACRDSARGL